MPLNVIHKYFRRNIIFIINATKDKKTVIESVYFE